MEINWQQIKQYKIDENQVHIWYINIEDYLDRIADFYSLLNENERLRAKRFKFKKDHDCFVVSHSVLRILIGKYLNCLPKIICFNANEYGKPFVLFNQKPTPLEFNLSHSHERALIAITEHHAIGADIERMNHRLAGDEIVERFFSEHERLEYQILSEDQRAQGFYNAWTRKEAFIKAIGKGIFYELNKFSVRLTSEKPAKIISIENNMAEADQWQLHGFMPEEKYCAAVTWCGQNKELCFFKY